MPKINTRLNLSKSVVEKGVIIFIIDQTRYRIGRAWGVQVDCRNEDFFGLSFKLTISQIFYIQEHTRTFQAFLMFCIV